MAAAPLLIALACQRCRNSRRRNPAATSGGAGWLGGCGQPLDERRRIECGAAAGSSAGGYGRGGRRDAGARWRRAGAPSNSGDCEKKRRLRRRTRASSSTPAATGFCAMMKVVETTTCSTPGGSVLQKAPTAVATLALRPPCVLGPIEPSCGGPAIHRDERLRQRRVAPIAGRLSGRPRASARLLGTLGRKAARWPRRRVSARQRLHDRTWRGSASPLQAQCCADPERALLPVPRRLPQQRRLQTHRATAPTGRVPGLLAPGRCPLSSRSLNGLG